MPPYVLARHDDARYVSTDTIANVLRTYRKYLDLSPEEDAIVERLLQQMESVIASLGLCRASPACTLVVLKPARWATTSGCFAALGCGAFECISTMVAFSIC